MSSQNSFPNRFSGRPAPRPIGQDRPAQPQWTSPQPGHVPQSASWPQAAQGGDPRAQQSQPPRAPQQNYGGAPANASYGGQAASAYPQWGDYGDAPAGIAAGKPGGRAYAPQFEPYAPARGQQPQQQAQPQPMHPPQGHQEPRSFGTRGQWGTAATGFSEPSFAPQAPAPSEMHPAQHAQPHFQERPYHEPELSAADWHQPHAGEPHFGSDPYQQGAELGFAQPVAGELDPGYDEEDDEEYELEDAAPRRRRPFMIVAALAGAIMVGGSLAYGFKKLTAGGDAGTPPLIKSAAGPARMKPADAGGKQFPYADSKIMGRLGDGSASAAVTTSTATAATAAEPSGTTDDGGARKVSTLVVNRDGSIQAPATVPAAGAHAVSPTTSGAAGGPVSVPGMTLVDAFGAQRAHAQGSTVSPTTASNAGGSHADFKKVVVVPPPADASAPVKVTKINGSKSSSQSVTGSIAAERDDAVAPKHTKKKKLAKADTVATDADDTVSAPVTTSHGSGFVAVLASVPRSSSSRMDALKRFADLQQQYSDALQGKTPDVADANLGSKGAYHRLIAGPPGSRQEANAVCSKLKAAGYSSCWVMSY